MKSQKALRKLLFLTSSVALGCGQAKESAPPPPSPHAAMEEIEVRALKDIGLQVKKVSGNCAPRFEDPSQKTLEITKNHDGAYWLLTNVDCDQNAEFRIRAMTPDAGKKGLPKYCEQTVRIPEDLDKGDTLLLTCTFPRKDKAKYKGIFQYKLQVCVMDACTEPADPELNVKR